MSDSEFWEDELSGNSFALSSQLSEYLEQTLKQTAVEIVSSLDSSNTDSRESERVVYSILRRRVTRSNPTERQFELQARGRGFQPAVMSTAGDRSSVPLTASQLNQISVVEEAANGTGVDPANQQPTSSGGGATASGGVPVVPQPMGGGVGGTDLGNAVVGDRENGTDSQPPTPTILDTEGRTQDVFNRIDQQRMRDPSGGQLVDTSRRQNRSPTNSFNRTLSQIPQQTRSAFNNARSLFSGSCSGRTRQGPPPTSQTPSNPPGNLGQRSTVQFAGVSNNNGIETAPSVASTSEEVQGPTQIATIAEVHAPPSAPQAPPGTSGHLQAPPALGNGPTGAGDPRHLQAPPASQNGPVGAGSSGHLQPPPVSRNSSAGMSGPPFASTPHDSALQDFLERHPPLSSVHQNPPRSHGGAPPLGPNGASTSGPPQQPSSNTRPSAEQNAQVVPNVNGPPRASEVELGGPNDETLPDPAYFQRMEAHQVVLRNLATTVGSQGIRSERRLQTILGVLNEMSPDALLADAYELARDAIHVALMSSPWWGNGSSPLVNDVRALDVAWSPALRDGLMQTLQRAPPQAPPVVQTQTQRNDAPPQRVRYVPEGPENEGYVSAGGVNNHGRATRQALGSLPIPNPNIPQDRGPNARQPPAPNANPVQFPLPNVDTVSAPASNANSAQPPAPNHVNHHDDFSLPPPPQSRNVRYFRDPTSQGGSFESQGQPNGQHAHSQATPSFDPFPFSEGNGGGSHRWYQDRSFDQFMAFQRYDWPEGWEFDLSESSAVSLRDLKASPVHFDGNGLNFRSFRDYVKFSIHANRLLSIIQRTTLLEASLNPDQRDIVGAFPTSKIRDYAAMLAALDEHFGENGLESFERAVYALPQVDTGRTNTISALVGLLRKAAGTLTLVETKSIFSIALKKIGTTLRSNYVSYYRNAAARHISSLIQFLVETYKLETQASQPSSLGVRRNRTIVQVHSTAAEPESPPFDSEESEEFRHGEEYAFVMESKGRRTRGRQWDPKWTNCPVDGEQHFLSECPKFRNEYSRQQRLEVVTKNSRCRRCFSPYHGSPANPGECKYDKGRSKCEVCGESDHHTLLHEYPEPGKALVSSCSDTFFIDDAYKRDLEQLHTEQCTLLQSVIRVKNPSTGALLAVCCLIDSGCSHTQGDLGIADLLGVVGKQIECHTNGAGGMVFKCKGILAEVQFSDLGGSFSVSLPIKFVKKPAGDIPFVNWKNYQNRFDFLRDIDLPDPVFHQGLPQIPLIIGNDLACLLKNRPGSQQRGALAPLSPLAQETALGWAVCGYTSPDPPTTGDILRGKALVVESNIVLSRSDPTPFEVDANSSIFLSPPPLDKHCRRTSSSILGDHLSLEGASQTSPLSKFGNHGNETDSETDCLDAPLGTPMLDTEDQSEEVLDTCISFLATSRGEASEWAGVAFDLRRAFDVDHFSGDSQSEFGDELRAKQLFKDGFVEGPSGVCSVPVMWKENEPDLPANFTLASKKYEQHEKRMLKNNAKTNSKDFFDEKFAALKQNGYIHALDMSDPDTLDGFFLESFCVFNPRKTTSALRLVFNARALFPHKGRLKSLNSCILDCPNNMVPLINVLLRMSQHAVLIAGDVEHFFLRVKAPKCDQRYLKILWRDELDPETPLKVYAFDAHLLGKKCSPFICIEVAQHQARRYQAEFPLASKAITESMLVDDLATSVETPEKALKLKAEATALFGNHCNMRIRKWVVSSKEVREKIPEDELSPSIVIEGVDCKENHLVRCLGLILIAESDAFTYSYDLPVPEVWTRRSILGTLSKIFDPRGWISPFHVSGRVLFQLECLNQPESKLVWDEPIDGPGLKDIQEWIENCKDLSLVRIPRCQARHKDEDQSFTVDHPYFKHLEDCENPEYCHCFWINTASSWKSHPGLTEVIQTSSDSKSSTHGNVCKMEDGDFIAEVCPDILSRLTDSTDGGFVADTDDHSKDVEKLDDSILLGSSAFGLNDEIPLLFPAEDDSEFPEDERFQVLSQEYHCFSDASQTALGAVCYSLTHYLKGPPTVRQIFAKGRITPKGKGKIKTIPRLELTAALLATEVAGKVSQSFDLPDVKSKFTYWCDSQVALYWIRSSRRKKTFVQNRVVRILDRTEAENWRFCDGILNPADVVSRGRVSVRELLDCSLWWHGPAFLYKPPEYWPKNPVTVTPDEEALKEMMAEPGHLLLLANGKEDWHFDPENSSSTHPGRFNSLIALVRFVQVMSSYKKCLQAHTARVRNSSSEREKDLIRTSFLKRCKEVRIKLQSRLEQQKENDRLQSDFYRKLLSGKKPAWPVVSEDCGLSFEPRPSFQEVKHSLILEAQQDVYEADIKKLKSGSSVQATSSLARLKPFLNPATGLLEVQGRFASEDSDRFVVILPKAHPVTRLVVKDLHVNLLQHFGAVSTLMAETKKRYFIPQLKTLVVKLLDSCYSCRRRYPRMFKQQMSSFHPGKLPGRLGEGQSPFSFSGSVNCDFLGPVYTSQGRGKAREKRWIFLFVCATTKAIHLQLVYSSMTCDILTALMTFFMRRGVPKLIISDGQTGLSAADKELKLIRTRIEALKGRIDEKIHDYGGFAQFDWQFTAPHTPSANGQVERYVSTVKNAMTKMSEFNPKGCLTPPNTLACLKDKEMEFLLVRIEFVLNSAPLVHSMNKDDDCDALTRNHFVVGSNNPIRCSVPVELLDTPSEFSFKWFLIEEALLSFWDRWHTEHLDSIKKLSKWTSGDVKLEPNDLVMVVDKDDVEMKKRIKWPVAKVLKVHRDVDGRIQTVTLKYRNRETRRGIRHLAPLPGVDF